jgi:hypothetical protein
MAIRLTAALLILTCPTACSGVRTVSEPSLARGDDEWRQRQAELDAQANMQGMTQARQRAQQLAHTGRSAWLHSLDPGPGTQDRLHCFSAVGKAWMHEP